MYDPSGIRDNSIKRAIYKLYKSDWLMHHVKPFNIEKLYKQYIDNFVLDDDFYEDGITILNSINYDYTFKDFIEECGINGELYVCYDEFLENEYQDEEIIKGIIFHAFKDNKTAQAVFYDYQVDSSFDKNGEATFMDVKIQEIDLGNGHYNCKFFIDGKEFGQDSIPSAIKRILEYKQER